MLKFFDLVFLILFESELQTDQNQFGFEKGRSTSMCSWTAVEVVNYFARKGSSVYAALLDYRKAFDLVNHVKMFRNLMGISSFFSSGCLYLIIFSKDFTLSGRHQDPTHLV